MSWAEYSNAALDLTEAGGVLNSRPYRQGKQSLDGTKVFVRFIGIESAWAGGTQFATKADARTAANSGVYVMPPTDEEIAEQLAARKQNQRERVRKVVSIVRERYGDGLTYESYVSDQMLVEAEKVKAAGYAVGTSLHIDDLVSRLRAAPVNVAKITAISDGIIDDAAALRLFMLASENIYQAALRAIWREEDFVPMLDELRAL
jgi:hypothetical protein